MIENPATVRRLAAIRKRQIERMGAAVTNAAAAFDDVSFLMNEISLKTGMLNDALTKLEEERRDNRRK